MITKYSEFEQINEFKLSDLPSLKVSAKEAQEKIKDNVSEFLKISKEEMNKPENVEKLKTFLTGLHGAAVKIKNAMKSRTGQNAAILLTSIGMYSSLIAGIWNAIFNSGLAHWYDPTSFQLGGLFYLKLALFLFVVKLILKAYRNVSEFLGFVKGTKQFIMSIIGLFKNNKKENEEEIKESVNALLIEYELI